MPPIGQEAQRSTLGVRRPHLGAWRLTHPSTSRSAPQPASGCALPPLDLCWASPAHSLFPLLLPACGRFPAHGVPGMRASGGGETSRRRTGCARTCPVRGDARASAAGIGGDQRRRICSRWSRKLPKWSSPDPISLCRRVPDGQAAAASDEGDVARRKDRRRVARVGIPRGTELAASISTRRAGRRAGHASARVRCPPPSRGVEARVRGWGSRLSARERQPEGCGVRLNPGRSPGAWGLASQAAEDQLEPPRHGVAIIADGCLELPEGARHHLTLKE